MKMIDTLFAPKTQVCFSEKLGIGAAVIQKCANTSVMMSMIEVDNETNTVDYDIAPYDKLNHLFYVVRHPVSRFNAFRAMMGAEISQQIPFYDLAPGDVENGVLTEKAMIDFINTEMSRPDISIASAHILPQIEFIRCLPPQFIKVRIEDLNAYFEKIGLPVKHEMRFPDVSCSDSTQQWVINKYREDYELYLG